MAKKAEKVRTPSVPQNNKWKTTARKLLPFFIGAAVLIAVSVFFMTPIDEIERYEISVVPQSDGALEITYHLQWKVRNSLRGGPLTWVSLGIPNDSHQLLATGGSIKKQRISGSGYIDFDLDKSYSTGEVADFWFTIRQEQMLVEPKEGFTYPFYDMIPGWFDEIEVKYYRFLWVDSPQIAKSSANRSENGWLVWDGSLPKGNRCRMQIKYLPSAFPNAQMVSQDSYIENYYSYYYKPKSSSDDDDDYSLPIFMVFMAVVVLINLSGYRGGRHYHGHCGGGGGCACACAGCACACACAGGGRAGCAAKDFTPLPTNQTAPDP